MNDTVQAPQQTAQLATPDMNTPTTPETPISRRAALLAPLSNRDFRLLWAGESISILGDQFYFVALPWLTLQLTGSGLALGTVLMIGGIPRAILMLVGGALSDRFDPRNIMIFSNLIRGGLVAVLTLLIVLGRTELWHLYVISLLFGAADAFFYPAYNALLPKIVGRDHLESSNALLQLTAHLGVLVGPALAGLVIARGASADALAQGDSSGNAFAFGLDTLTFFFSTAMLALIRTKNRQERAAQGDDTADTASSGVRGLLISIREAIAYVLTDPPLRAILILIAVVDFAVVGPLNVGIATLADMRFPVPSAPLIAPITLLWVDARVLGGAAALGVMLSGFGAGALLGTILGGLARVKRPGFLILGIAFGIAIALPLIGIAPFVLFAAVFMAMIGVGSGLFNVIGVTWLQRRSKPEMIGRVMSLVMLASVGGQPLSNALAGVLADANLTLMFVVAGTIILVATVREALVGDVQRM
ncbi:MAG: MFS transporter [Burkholderiales bacterium]|nr:MFS transporter [Anaerolineae bacterium]